MKGWSIAFTGDWPALAVLVGAAAAALLAYTFYRRKADVLPERAFSVLTWLRTLAIVTVAVFMLQPVLRLTRAEAARTGVAVLLDHSESMGILDTAGDRSRLEAGVALLRDEAYDLLRKLKRNTEVRLFVFGAVPAEVTAPRRLAEITADENATAIGDTLQGIVKEVGRDSLAAVLLLTDGVSTRGQKPQDVAGGLGVPVLPVALGGRVGEKGLFHDVAVASVPRDLQTIVDTTAHVEVGLSHRGLGRFAGTERQLTVTLTEDDETVAEEKVSLSAEDGAAVVRLKFVPGRVGLHRLRVRVPPLPDETVTENNSRVFTVEVTDPRIRVLLVEGVVRSEYRFLRRVLESDPNLELTSVVKLSGKRFLVQGVQAGVDLSRGLPARVEDYEKFDVVILGDIGRDEFTGLQLQYLKQFVDGGGALLAMGGYNAFGAGGYAGTPLADVLPVSLGDDRDGQSEREFVPILTHEGRAHPVLLGCDEFFDTNPERITLEGANRVTGLKPGAVALVVHPFERAGDVPMPVVAAQSYAGGRVLTMTADTTWKWKFQVEAQGMDSPYYRFWRQAVRWLAGRDVSEMAPDELVNAWSPQAEYKPGELVVVKARVRTRSRDPHEHATVEATLSYPAPVRTEQADGTVTEESRATLRLDPIPLSLGEYQASWNPPGGGLYEVDAVARDDAGELGTDRFEFVVGEAVSEFDRVDVDEDTLRALAARTGGTYHTMATASRIPDELEQRRTMVLRRHEVNLWNAPWLFSIFLACVTAEWIYRKRRNLN